MQLTRRHFLLFASATVGAWFWGCKSLVTNGLSTGPDRFREYVDAVTSGQGFLPWQERGLSGEEQRFREEVEARKCRLLEKARANPHGPVYSDEDFHHLKHTVLSSPSGEKWFLGV